MIKDGAEAWTAAASRGGRWKNMMPRFAERAYPLRHEAKFKPKPDSKFFCIGSCFARGIEDYLCYQDLEVLSQRIVVPKEEWPGRPTSLTNKFTTLSMLHEVTQVTHPQTITAANFAEDEDGWFDLHLAPKSKPVTLERAVERRRYLRDEYFSRIGRADIVIATLGLDETWVDLHSGERLNAAPSPASVRRQPGRFGVEALSYEANLGALEALREAIKALSPNCRMIVTVSPVPMNVTFSGLDPVIANARSKAVLRTAAERFSQQHDDVDYFPSYELVTNSPPEVTWVSDRRHVTEEILGHVVGLFMRSYLDTEPVIPPYVELDYLVQHPEVLEAVRRGELASGYEHWRKTA